MTSTVTEISPVTQQELTQSEIQNSMKVSKQVILTKVKEEVANVHINIMLQEAALKERFCGDNGKGGTKENDLTVIMRERFAEIINSDIGLRHLRLATTHMTGIPTLTKNMQLVLTEDCYDVSNYVYKPNSRMFKDILKTGVYAISYCTAGFLPDRKELTDLVDDRYHDDVNPYLSFTIDVRVPKETLDAMSEVVETQKIIDGNRSKMSSLQYKIDNIDTTMEELEAKILVNHMAKSAHGKEVLAVTSSIVSEIIGEESPLLSEFKEK